MKNDPKYICPSCGSDCITFEVVAHAMIIANSDRDSWGTELSESAVEVATVYCDHCGEEGYNESSWEQKSE